MRFPTALPLLVATLLTGLVSQAAITRNSERSFKPSDFSAGGLKVELFSGSISVEQGDSPDLKVVVKATYDVDKEDQADKLQSYLKLSLDSKDGRAVVLAEYLRDLHWTMEDWPPVKLVVVVEVPKGVSLDLQTKDGSITVGNLSGQVKARTESGLLYLKGLEGAADLASFSGDIVVAHCTGDLNLRSVSGDFTVGPVAGAIVIAGHGGSVEATSATPSIRAETTGSDLSVLVPAGFKGEAAFKSSGGNVVLTLDPRLAANLDLHSSIFAKVGLSRGQLPVVAEEGGFGKRSLRGALNGGGAKLSATVSGGSVLLEAANSAN